MPLKMTGDPKHILSTVYIMKDGRIHARGNCPWTERAFAEKEREGERER